jgi:hypothetical protein
MPTVSYDWVTAETSFPINNVVLTGNQTYPAITAINGGTQFLSVWQASTTVMSGRIFDLAGNPVGSEFTVYENWLTNPTDPSVTQLTGGNILVTWHQGGDIVGRVLSSAGVPGSVISITTGSIVDSDSDVTSLADGGFVVSWTRDYTGGDLDVNAQVYNADGSVRVGVIGVDVATATATSQSQVVGLSNGNFAVVYKLEPKAGGDDEVWFQVYNSMGGTVAAATLVDTSGTIEDDPQVVALYGGAFAVAYVDNGWGTGSTEITLRIYNADGSPRTSYIGVNTVRTGDQINPTISMLSNGYIVVSWNNGTELVSQAYTQDGVPVGTNDVTINQVVEAEIAGLQGGLVVNIRESTVTDGSGTSIRGSIEQLQRHIIGDATAELLIGDSLPDTIEGGGGNDIITGGLSSDLLVGGTGNDTFRDFAQGLNGDVIADFGRGDVINILGANASTFTFSVSGNTLTFTGGALTLSTVPVGAIVVREVPGNGVELVVHDPQNDFNGDGRSDLFWRNGAGTASDWLGQANGGFIGNGASSLAVGLDWHVQGFGDFNGDGRDDVLWRNDGGTVAYWYGMKDGGFEGNGSLYMTVSDQWHIVGTGDFNGDGRDDVLWRGNNGIVTDWLGQADGTFVSNNASVFNPVGLDWHIAGTGDFNGDGRDDVLWRNDGGTITNWLGQPDGGFIGNASLYTTIPNSWHILGTGDFNGDGRDDILLRNDNGSVTDWLGQPDGGFISNIANANLAVGADWQFADIGDYNGDGRDDVLWRHDTGTVTDWLGQRDGGFVGNGDNLYTPVGNDWHVQPQDSLWL